MRLHVVPLELAEANRLVAQWHRHHQPSQGHRFSLGVMDGAGVLHGAAVAAGWECEGEAGGGQWKHTDGKPRRTDQPTGLKTRWSKQLAQRPDLTAPPQRTNDAQSDDLFGGAA